MASNPNNMSPLPQPPRAAAAGARGCRTAAAVIALLMLIFIGLPIVFALIVGVTTITRDSASHEEQEAFITEVQKEEDATFEAIEATIAELGADGSLSAEWSYEGAIRRLSAVTDPAVIAVADELEYLPGEESEHVLIRLAKEFRNEIEETETAAHLDPRTRTMPEIQANLGACLADMPELREIEAAIDLGLCRRTFDLRKDPPDDTFQEKQYDAFKLLAAKTLLEIRAGNVDAGFEGWQRLARWETLLRDEPRLGGFQWLPWLSSASTAPLWELVDARPFTSKEREQVIELLSDRGDWEAFARAIKVSAHQWRVLCNERETMDSIGFRIVHLQQWELANEFAALCDKTPVETEDAISDIWERVPVWASHTGYLIGEVYEAHEKLWRESMGADLARLVFTLKDYKAAEGAYPPDLETLVPDYLEAIPQDPVYGDTVEYLRIEEGFVLTAPDVGDESDYDLLWRAER
jgi:hypothetical protein